MNSIPSDVAKEFCNLCNWTYECWLTYRRLFDDNNHTESTIVKAGYFMERLSKITQEYVLLQICKLHDPAIQGNSLNLTIDYIVRFGGWGPDEERIQNIVSQLTTLFEKIKPVRSKIVVHNDLLTLMNTTELGKFPKDLDVKYFLMLQELVNAVSQKWLDGPYSFNDLAGAGSISSACSINR